VNGSLAFSDGASGPVRLTRCSDAASRCW
jgi:hypothetical protein